MLIVWAVHALLPGFLANTGWREHLVTAGGEKHKSVQMANTQVGAAKRTIVVADAQNRSAPRPKPVLEAPKSKRKKHKAANTDDLDRVLSSRSAALFGNKTLQLDSQWFD